MKIPGLRQFMHIDSGARGVRRSIDDELQFHFDMTVERLRANGLSLDDARAEAERRFGSVAAAKQRLESIDSAHAAHERRANVWDAVRQDLRYALRGLRRNPSFTAVVILTFALGIGANAAMFGVIDRLLLRAPSLIADPDRVVRIYFARPGAGGTPSTNQSATFPSLVDLRAHAAAFADVAIYDAATRSLGTGADARQVHTLAATSNFFPLLGVHAAYGRLYSAAEDTPPDGTPVAVIAYEFWQSEFGADRSVIGRSLTLDNVRFTIIGVAPPRFTGVDLDPVDVFVPLSASAVIDDRDWSTAKYMTWASGIAKLAPGVPLAAARVEAQRVLRADAANLGGFDRSARIELGPIPRALGPETGEARTRGRVAEWLTGVSLALLLIACANIANLLLARAMRRRREIAVRLALGIGTARLVMSLLMESMLLAIGVGVVGVTIVWAGGRSMQAIVLPDTTPRTTWFDPHVALAAAIAVVATGLLTGIAPAVHVRRRDFAATLKAGGRDGALHRSRLRTGLMILQTALSVVLLVGAGLFVRSLRNIRTMDYGYDPAKIVFVDIDLPQSMSRDARLALWDRMYERAATLPGIERASLSMTTPFWSTRSAQVSVPGRDSIPQTASGRPYMNSISPNYFTTMGTRLRSGRFFTTADVLSAPRVAIVNETLARVVWPGENPLGKCVQIGRGNAPYNEVVGVVQDMKQRDIRGESAMQVYVPIAQAPGAMRTLSRRTKGNAAPQRDAIRRALAASEPSGGFVSVRTLQERIEPQVHPWTLGAEMFSVFGLLALFTAAIGLYSVIAYGVTQRIHELGVRAALGANEGTLIRLVLGDGLRVAVAGLAVGGAIALVATRWIGNLLFDVSQYDPAVYAFVGATLLAAAVVPSFLPAIRASRVDPATALRAD